MSAMTGRAKRLREDCDTEALEEEAGDDSVFDDLLSKLSVSEEKRAEDD